MTYFDKKGIEAKKKQLEELQNSIKFEEEAFKEQEKIIYKETSAVVWLNIIIIILSIATIVMIAFIMFWLKVLGQ